MFTAYVSQPLLKKLNPNTPAMEGSMSMMPTDTSRCTKSTAAFAVGSDNASMVRTGIWVWPPTPATV